MKVAQTLGNVNSTLQRNVLQKRLISVELQRLWDI